MAWPAELPTGWTETSTTTATYTVMFKAVSCTPVMPADPVVTLATCTAGEVTAPSVTVGPTTGITYVVAPVDLGDGTAAVDVVITATVDDGFGWGTVVAPWVRVDAATATVDADVAGGGSVTMSLRWRRR